MLSIESEKISARDAKEDRSRSQRLTPQAQIWQSGFYFGAYYARHYKIGDFFFKSDERAA